MSKRSNHYLLIKSDGFDAAGRPMSARMSAAALLDAGFWPIWQHTPNKLAVKAGDRVAIYLTGNSCVIATAKIRTIGAWDKAAQLAYPLSLDDVPYSVLHLGEVKLFDAPVDVKARLCKLSFFKPGTKKWGVHFMGGIRSLIAADFNTLTR